MTIIAEVPAERLDLGFMSQPKDINPSRGSQRYKATRRASLTGESREGGNEGGGGEGTVGPGQSGLAEAAGHTSTHAEEEEEGEHERSWSAEEEEEVFVVAAVHFFLSA